MESSPRAYFVENTQSAIRAEDCTISPEDDGTQKSEIFVTFDTFGSHITSQRPEYPARLSPCILQWPEKHDELFAGQYHL